MQSGSGTEYSVGRLARLIEESGNTVVLTGAGVSTASGIPDFRSPLTGVWENVDPAQVASIQAFRRDPARFWEFYSRRLSALGAVKPNPAHTALARLEEAGWLRGVITQNIDRLHRSAGSVATVEVHGSIETAECLECGDERAYEHVMDDVARGSVPSCSCGAPLKPGVVLFGEALPEDALSTAVEWAEDAELMIVVGSSLRVWPVAGLPETTVSCGGRLAILNREPTPFDRLAVHVDRGPVEAVLPMLAECLRCPDVGGSRIRQGAVRGGHRVGNV